MKLAEALLLRADLQRRLASLRERLEQNVMVQEGDEPIENPTKLLKEVELVVNQLEELVFKINQTNLEHKLANGKTLTQALARRDALISYHSILSSAAENSGRQLVRYSASEIKWIPTVNVADLRKKTDKLAEEIRILNAAIQEANWLVEIKL